MASLRAQKCIPCEGGVPPLTADKVAEYNRQIDGWQVIDNTRIRKEWQFDDFVAALAFVNRAGEIAEEAGHHPDLNLHSWNRVAVTLYTHAIGGLSVNDFIVADRIDHIKL